MGCYDCREKKYVLLTPIHIDLKYVQNQVLDDTTKISSRIWEKPIWQMDLCRAHQLANEIKSNEKQCDSWVIFYTILLPNFQKRLFSNLCDMSSSTSLTRSFFRLKLTQM